MTRNEAIAELVRIWHSPHLDLSLKAGLAEAIDTLKESNLNDSLVRGEVDDCKESESKLDLISRQDAIEAIESRQTEQWIESDIDYNSGIESALCEIKALPSADITETETCQRCQDLTDTILNRQGDEIKRLKAEAVQGWIPVSERLPDADDCPMDCMVTRKSKFIGNYVDIAVAEKNGTWTHEDWNAIVIDGKAKCISTRDADIIAWMPLPEPYKGGDSE